MVTLIPGTKHPINYYIITDPNVKETNDKMADGVFDIKNNTLVLENQKNLNSTLIDMLLTLKRK
jgi:hypothetical protein